MIETNELRIKNYLQDRKGNLCQVFGIGLLIEGCNIYALESAITSLPIEPIPLNEEWLVKCGFDKKQLDRHSYFELPVNNTKFITDDNGKVRIGVQGFAQHEYLLLELEYVHQLQNIYFYLTGKELTLKH